jgi:hypothetical protein
MLNTTNKESRAIKKVLYKKVAEEMEKKEIDKGLWTIALSECSGDKMAAESEYIKLRAQDIVDERIEQFERVREIELKKVRGKITTERNNFFKYLFIIILMGSLFAIAIVLIT